MTRRQSLLCVSTLFPWPANSGGAIRVDGFLRQLSVVYDVHLLAVRAPDGTATVVKDIEASYPITVEIFDGNQLTQSRAGAAIVRLQSLARRIPPWIYGRFDRHLLARFAELARDADAVILLEDFSGVYPLLAPPADTPLIVDKHVVLARPRSAGEGAHPRDRLLRRLTSSYERRYVGKANKVVVTTDEDGQWLHDLYGRTPSAIIPTGVALGPLRAARSAPRRRVGWLSALDVSDNIDGLKRFLASGWPLLAAKGYELYVAGRRPAASVREMTSVAGVHLVGQVESVDDFLADIDVAVIPLWSGRGIKVKTLTLMAAGLPVAATPMAIEGMVVEDGRHLLVGNTPEELAAHVARLLEDESLADAMGAAARQLVADTYTWDAVGLQFIKVVEQAISAHGTRPRQE